MQVDCLYIWQPLVARRPGQEAIGAICIKEMVVLDLTNDVEKAGKEEAASDEEGPASKGSRRVVRPFGHCVEAIEQDDDKSDEGGAVKVKPGLLELAHCVQVREQINDIKEGLG